MTTRNPTANATAGPSTTPFAKDANGSAQDDRFFAGFRLLGAAGDGGDEHDLVAVLEGVAFAAKEADVFVIDVDVDEAAELAIFAFDLGGEGWKGLVDVSEEGGEILGGGVEVFAAVGVAGKGGGQRDFDRHYLAP